MNGSQNKTNSYFNFGLNYVWGLYSITMQNVFAHESRLYSIGNKDYWITVGSIGEPVFVDDKSGAEAFISTADPANPLDSDSNGSKMIISPNKENLILEHSTLF